MSRYVYGIDGRKTLLSKNSSPPASKKKAAPLASSGLAEDNVHKVFDQRRVFAIDSRCIPLFPSLIFRTCFALTDIHVLYENALR